MKKKITYTDEPVEIGARVDDSFLPSPEEIAQSLKKSRISINISDITLDAIKHKADELQIPYQKIIQTVLDNYANNHVKGQSL